MLDYLKLPIYYWNLIYTYLKHQLAHETYGKHVEKFKSTLDFIKNPCYDGKYFDPDNLGPCQGFWGSVLKSNFYMYKTENCYIYYNYRYNITFSYHTEWVFNNGERYGFKDSNNGYIKPLYRSGTKKYKHLDKLSRFDLG